MFGTLCQPAVLTKMARPRLIFESASHFPQSEIQSVFRFLRKWLANPNLCTIITPFGEKCGLKSFHERGPDEAQGNPRSSEQQDPDSGLTAFARPASS